MGQWKKQPEFTLVTMIPEIISGIHDRAFLEIPHKRKERLKSSYAAPRVALSCMGGSCALREANQEDMKS